MYPNPYGANAYSQASQNVSPMKAVIMLYEGVIRLINEAKVHNENGDFEARFKAVEKASKIILGLQGQLDFENGGEISPILHQFYDNLFTRMMQINSRDPEPIISDVLESLKEMKETWIEVNRKTSSSSVSEQQDSSSSKTAVRGSDEILTSSSSLSV
ncbi:flagellar export chaperone FliS [Kiloniella litopenaei]|uniref:flagellar export chaperone FliS n=1 Tax=Kiloniella litopenaei TaxID=1549748 RepID=UPI003BAD674F